MAASEGGISRKLLLAAVIGLCLVVFAGVLLVQREPPAAGPSNGWILFQAREDAERVGESSGSDIYAVAEGVVPRRVLGASGDATDQTCPAFAPNGQTLSYVDGGDLVIARLEGGGVVEESRFDRQLDPAGPCPRWSPDGTKVAFLVQGRTSLRILSFGVGPDRGNIVGPSVGAGQIADFEWSPDNATVGIAYPDQVLGVPLAGERLVRLITGVQPGIDVANLPTHDEFSSIAWSPVTGLLAISGSVRGPDDLLSEEAVGGEFVQIANTEGRSLRELAATPIQGAGYDITWSPDGGTIAYVDIEAGLQLLARDGSMKVGGFTPIPASGAVWSPDGKALILLTPDPWRLVSVSVDPAEAPVELVAGDGLGLTGPGQMTWQALR
jgi:hypothetical protein